MLTFPPDYFTIYFIENNYIRQSDVFKAQDGYYQVKNTKGDLIWLHNSDCYESLEKAQNELNKILTTK